MDDKKKLIGLRIKKQRLLRRWQQEELAYRAQLQRNYISSIENGKRNISVNVLFLIAKAFDMTIAELLDGIDSKEKGDKLC